MHWAFHFLGLPKYSYGSQEFVSVCVTPVGDSMWEKSNGRQFTTHDQDHDEWDTGSCPQKHGGGGWWYGGCALADLNSQYGQGTGKAGIRWYSWKNNDQYYKASRILLRPVSHTGWGSPPSITTTLHGALWFLTPIQNAKRCNSI